MFSYHHWRDSDTDDKIAQRQTDGLAGLAVVLLLLVGGLFLVQQLRAASMMQDCLLSGRHNCPELLGGRLRQPDVIPGALRHAGFAVESDEHRKRDRDARRLTGALLELAARQDVEELFGRAEFSGLVRHRLTSRLTDPGMYRVGSVVAPAGSGKSRLLAHVALSFPGPVAWCGSPDPIPRTERALAQSAKDENIFEIT